MTNNAEERLQWENFLSYGARQYLKKDYTVYNQGNLSGGFYWVESGLIKIKTCSVQGDVKNINIIGPGQLFGELSLIKSPSIASAIVVEHSIIYFFSVEKVTQMMKDSPNLIMLILNSLLSKLSVLVETSFHSTAEQQIAYSLMKLSELTDNQSIAIKQKDLSEYTGLTRMTLNTVLKKWKKADIIDIGKKVILIKNPKVLSDYSKVNVV